MTDILRLPICVLLLISSAYYANGELETVPQNVVYIQGQTVVLTCSAYATPAARVMWSEFATQSTGLILSDGKGIVPTHPNAARYQIIGGPLDFNLQITNASLGDGGRYLCQDINGVGPVVNRGTGELIMLDDDPLCTGLATVTGVVVEGRFYNKECDVNYRGNFAPNITWTGPGDYVVDNSVTQSSVWSRVSFIADREIEGKQFISTTRFYVPENLPIDAATNVPTYLHTFPGSVLIVNWGPATIDIFPLQSQYDVGDVLTCSADAKPPPTYRWTNIRTQQEEPIGPTFTVTASLLGTSQMMRCNAISNIEGSLYVADGFVNVTVPEIPTTTTPGITTPTTPPPADGPCNDLTGQWTSTNPNANLCIEMDSKGNLLALLRNGTDLFFVTGTGKTVINDYKHVGFTAQWPPGSLFGVGGFTGECHSCFGNEIILISGLSRSKDQGTQCGISAGTRLTNLYAFTRFGPPCRTPPVKVYRPSEMHIKVFGIQPEQIMS